MDYQTSLKRLNTLRGQIKYTADSVAARNSATLSVAVARKAIWSYLKPEVFEVFEAWSELEGVQLVSKYVESTEQQRIDSTRIFVQLVNKLFEKGYTSPKKIADNIDLFVTACETIHAFDPAVATRFMTHYSLYCKTIKNLGTEKHTKLLLDATAMKHIGSYSLTELGHGSNVRGMETTAVYDPENQEFIINSPTDTSIKFWIGALGKVCNHTIVNAQLITQGKNYGVHAFVCQVRDTEDHMPLEGLEIGD